MPEAAQTGRVRERSEWNSGPLLCGKKVNLFQLELAYLSCLQPAIIRLTSWVKYMGCIQDKGQ